jgi:hypothetical protein
MKLTEPVLNKAQLLKVAGITSTTFNNWCLRGHIPLAQLGCEKVSLTRYKYTFLTAAYCALLSYFRGNKRKIYLRMLKSFVCGVAKDGYYNDNATIAIANSGKGPDCGIFDNYGAALDMRNLDVIYVDAGKILNKALELHKQHEVSNKSANKKVGSTL